MDHSRVSSADIASFHRSANPAAKFTSSSRITSWCAPNFCACFRTEMWLKKQPRAPTDGKLAALSGRIAEKNSASQPIRDSCFSISIRLSLRCSRLMTKIAGMVLMPPKATKDMLYHADPRPRTGGEPAEPRWYPARKQSRPPPLTSTPTQTELALTLTTSRLSCLQK